MRLNVLFLLPLLLCWPATELHFIGGNTTDGISQPISNRTNAVANSIQLNSLDSLLKSSDIVIIDFWFSGCGSCRKSMPELNEIYDEFLKKKVQIYGINPIDDVTKIEKIKTQYAVKYPLIQVSSEVAQKYRVEEYPLLMIFQKSKPVLTLEGYSALFEKQIKDKLSALVN